jgi:hypothetical protein
VLIAFANNPGVQPHVGAAHELLDVQQDQLDLLGPISTATVFDSL